jgi:hypothetical protein
MGLGWARRTTLPTRAVVAHAPPVTEFAVGGGIGSGIAWGGEWVESAAARLGGGGSLALGGRAGVGRAAVVVGGAAAVVLGGGRWCWLGRWWCWLGRWCWLGGCGGAGRGGNHSLDAAARPGRCGHQGWNRDCRRQGCNRDCPTLIGPAARQMYRPRGWGRASREACTSSRPFGRLCVHASRVGRNAPVRSVRSAARPGRGVTSRRRGRA